MRQKCQTKQTNLLEISLNLNWTVHLWSADIEKGNICQIFPWSAGQSSVSVNKIPDWIHTKIRDSLLKFIPKFATPVPIYIYTHIYIYTYIYILTIYIYRWGGHLWIPTSFCSSQSPHLRHSQKAKSSAFFSTTHLDAWWKTSPRRCCGEWLVNGKWLVIGLDYKLQMENDKKLFIMNWSNQ